MYNNCGQRFDTALGRQAHWMEAHKAHYNESKGGREYQGGRGPGGGRGRGNLQRQQPTSEKPSSKPGTSSNPKTPTVNRTVHWTDA